jgi:putative spermidine/putrescine transport system substrate-binding protein
VAVAALAVLVGACGDSGGSDKAKTATSAADMGGMEELVKAAEAEGKLNVIALPPEWANYKGVIAAFKAKYPKITVDEASPDANSQEEIDAANNLKDTDKAPDVFDLGVSVALANTALFAPYKVAAWADIPDNLKESTGLWSDYAGFMSIGCDTAKVPAPATVADLLKPEYKGAIALNGNPKTAGAALNGVVMASLANGGAADNIAPGVEFFNQLNEAGNLLPVDPTAATIAAGQTPCVIDWEYNNAALTADLAGKGIDWKVTIPSDAPPVAAYYIQAINKDAPHPAAARLWQEFLYTPEAQNEWLKGFARPILQEAMIRDGTIDEAALAAVAQVEGTPVVLTQDQVKTVSDYLAANWNIELP